MLIFKSKLLGKNEHVLILIFEYDSFNSVNSVALQSYGGPWPAVPISAFVTVGPGVQGHMPWTSGQLDAGPPVFSSQANLVLILSTHSRDERLSEPCPARGSNRGPVAWQRKALTTVPPGVRCL